MQKNKYSWKDGHGKDDPTLSNVIERNICTIIHLRKKAAYERSLQSRITDAIQDKRGIVDRANNELADLEMETKPVDVLAEIHRLQAIERNTM